MQLTVEEAARVRAGLPFVIAGVMSIVAGGFAAALTGPLDLAHGSWLAAYLVLVGGVAQIILGIGSAVLSSVPPSTSRTSWELGAFNLGNLGVMAGTLASITALTDVGGAILVAALVLFVLAVADSTDQHRLVLWVYRAMVVILAVSIPIGLLLAYLRS